MNTWAGGDLVANGIRLHYHRTGGDKPALLMAHGLTDSGLCWQRLARALEDQYDLIMVDARGHGASDKPESNYSVYDHAADLAGVIRALALTQPAVIGHSMGGASAALLAAQHPELVSRLILEDPAWFPPDGKPESIRSDAENAAIRQEWNERLVARKALAIDELTAATRRDNPLWSAEEFPAHSEAKHQASLHVTQFIGARSKPWWEQVPTLRCPTLVLTGDSERGAIITDEMAAKIKALNPRVEVVKLAEAGHNVRREQFDDFVRHVRRYLAAQ